MFTRWAVETFSFSFFFLVSTVVVVVVVFKESLVPCVFALFFSVLTFSIKKKKTD